ncbi:MAG: hypothetical protein LBP79_01365 [Clostridiales bacterium]|jgi:cell division protein FtsA|nr:hypothetical protein [Clostridiales bacterium]
MQKNNEVAVLDIGSGKIRAAVAEKNSRVSIIPRGIGEADYAGYSDGQWLEPEKLKSAALAVVEKAEALSGCKIKKIFVGMPAEFMYSVCKEVALVFDKARKISSGEMSELLKRGDKFDNEDKYFTINCSPVYFLLGDNKRIIEPRGLVSDTIKALVSYIRCDRAAAEKIRGAFEGTGIRVEFVSAVLAETLYLFEPQERDRYVLFADIGYISSSLAILRGDGILHLSSFSLGGAHISADISELFGIPFAEAERIKDEVGLDGLDETVRIKLGSSSDGEISGKDLSVVIRDRLCDFADAIKLCIKKSFYDCPLHITLFLTGGGISSLKGAKEFLSEIIGRNIEIIAPNVPKYDKPYYSSLFGLVNIGGSADDAEAEAAAKSKKGLFYKLFNKFGGK